MRYAFHPSAKIELIESIDYYESCQAGLGAAFAKEIFSSIQRIVRFPEAWMKLSDNSRRCLTNRFPFGIIYHVSDDEIFIVAVMQLNRKPGYWKDRSR